MNAPQADLDQLLSKRLDGDWTESDQAQLESLLLNNPDARARYLDVMMAHAVMQETLGVHDDLDLDELLLLEEVKKGELDLAVQPERGAPSATLPVEKSRVPLLGFLDQLPTAIHPAHHPIWFFAAAVMFTSVFWGVVVLFVLPRSRQQENVAQPLHPQQAFTARLMSVEDAVWAESSPPLRAGALLSPGQQLGLVSGRMQILFGDGTRVGVEGPAMLRIESRNRATLERGRILARVVSAAPSFTVQTPIVVIVDLGTEFGLEVAARTTEVQVFEGAVEARRLDSSKDEGRRIVAGTATLFEDSPQLGFQEKERKMNKMLYASLAAILMLPEASAIAITVPNASFEDNVLADNGATSATTSGDTTVVQNWVTAVSASTVQIGSFNPTNTQFAGATGGNLPSPASGPQAAFLNLNSTTSGESGSLTSVAGLTTIQANSKYTLTIAVGNSLNRDTGTASISLLANGTPIPGAVTTFPGSEITSGTFKDYTVSFETAILGDPLVGQELKIRLGVSKLVGTPQLVNIYYDNVRLEVSEIPLPAPEPATGAALGVGGMLVLGVARRRKRR